MNAVSMDWRCRFPVGSASVEACFGQASRGATLAPGAFRDESPVPPQAGPASAEPGTRQLSLSDTISVSFFWLCSPGRERLVWLLFSSVLIFGKNDCVPWNMDGNALFGDCFRSCVFDV